MQAAPLITSSNAVIILNVLGPGSLAPRSTVNIGRPYEKEVHLNFKKNFIFEQLRLRRRDGLMIMFPDLGEKGTRRHVVSLMSWNEEHKLKVILESKLKKEMLNAYEGLLAVVENWRCRRNVRLELNVKGARRRKSDWSKRNTMSRRSAGLSCEPNKRIAKIVQARRIRTIIRQVAVLEGHSFMTMVGKQWCHILDLIEYSDARSRYRTIITVQLRLSINLSVCGFM
jgi:hypothetical protein